MADPSFLTPITLAAGAAVLIFSASFLVLHLRYRAKRRAQMDAFDRLRAGAQ